MPGCNCDVEEVWRHPCVEVEGDCKFVSEEDLNNSGTVCFEGVDKSGAGEVDGPRLAWLEVGD